MRIIGITMLAFLLLSVTAIAQEAVPTLYDSDNPVDEETAQQVRIMASSSGAEVRLLQLESNIERNILFGNTIIERLQEEHPDYDTSQLETLIAELELVKEEVVSQGPSQDTDEVVKTFVDLKSDAVDITKEFRTLARQAVNVTEAESLKQQIGRQLSPRMVQIRNLVKEKIGKHNMEVINRTLSTFNSNDEALLRKAEGLNVSPEELKIEVKRHLDRLPSDQRIQAVMQLKRVSATLSVKTQSAINAAEDGYQERVQNRLQERIRILSDVNTSMIEKRLRMVEFTLTPELTSKGNGSQGPSATGQVTGGMGR